MAETELDTIREMLRVTAAAQLLLDGDTLAAASAAAQSLFPMARPGASAEEIFGETAERLRQLQPGESLLFSVDTTAGRCDVTATGFQGYVLATAEETGESLSHQTLLAIGERYRQSMAAAMAVTPKILPLLEEVDGDALKQAAELNRSLYAMLRVTDNLQFYGGARENMMLQPRRIDLRAWLETLLDRVEPLVESAGLTLIREIGNGVLSCRIDEEQMERALLNLLSNAMKYSRPGGAITVSLRTGGKQVTLTVRDQGAGIPPDQMGHIYSRSEHRGLIPDPRWGVGLGLPIVRRIVEAHGGRMMLESRAGEGTAVHIALNVRGRSDGVLRSPVILPERSGGLDTALVELADVLPAEVYDTRGIDL